MGGSSEESSSSSSGGNSSSLNPCCGKVCVKRMLRAACVDITYLPGLAFVDLDGLMKRITKGKDLKEKETNRYAVSHAGIPVANTIHINN